MPLFDYLTATALMLLIPTAAFLALAGLLHLSALAVARWRRWRERRAIGREVGGAEPWGPGRVTLWADAPQPDAPQPAAPHCTCCELRLPEPGGDARLYRRVHEQAQADRQRIAELERELAEARSALPAAWLRARLCLRAKNEWMERALEAERKELEREQRAQPEVGGVHRARWEDLAHALREAEHDLQCETERADALQQRLDELGAAYQRACDSLREETELRCAAEAERDEARQGRAGSHTSVVVDVADGIEACLRTLARCAGWEVRSLRATERRDPPEHALYVELTWRPEIVLLHDGGWSAHAALQPSGHGFGSGQEAGG